MDPAVWAAITAGAAALGASIITNRVAGRASRRDSMLRWAAQMQANEQAARAEAQQSRERAERIKEQADRDVEGLRVKLADFQTQLEKATVAVTRLTDKLTMVATEVWRPEPDIHALRRLVGRPRADGVNGNR